MSMQPRSEWHLDDAQLRAYAAGALDFAGEASVEAHLLACANCRGVVAPLVHAARVDTVWANVVDELDAPRQTLLERVLVRFGVAEGTARLLAATPSLRTSWFAAVAVALFFALVAAHSAPHGTLIFLLVAPVLPVAGVAAAYGRHADPAYDVGLAAPYSSFRLVLLRSTAVLVTTAALAAATAALLPAGAWLAAAWLLPALALTSATLALSMRFDAVWSAGVVATAWVVVVGGRVPVLGADAGYAAFGVAGQLSCAAIVLISGIVLFGRHRGLTDAPGSPA